MSLSYMTVSGRKGMSALLKKELDTEFCRGVGTLLAGDGQARSILAGTPIGEIIASGLTSVTAVAAEDNTGNGILTLADPAFTSAIKAGRYTVTFLDAATDAGDFQVEGPDGKVVGAGTAGAAFGKQVKFTIADGATDFVAGDQFFIDVVVAAGDDGGKLVAWDPAAGNGSEVIKGICLRDCVAADGSDNIEGLLYAKRLSILVASEIVWPEGITAGQKAAALNDMDDRLGLIIR